MQNGHGSDAGPGFYGKIKEVHESQPVAAWHICRCVCMCVCAHRVEWKCGEEQSREGCFKNWQCFDCIRGNE